MRLKKLLKKFKIKTSFNIPGSIPIDRVDIWLQDEARFGQQNTTIRLWAETGSRPKAVKQQQFEYAYLFGSVCVTNGTSEAMVVPFVNKDIMKTHLQQISKATASDRHAVVIMGGAGWHSDGIETGFDNIIDEVCKAWNDFVSIPERVKNMCFRDWMLLTS